MELSFICTLWITSNTKALISVSIPDGDVLGGDIPRSKMKLLQAWTELHKDELVADWELAVSGQQLYKIEPLR